MNKKVLLVIISLFFLAAIVMGCGDKTQEPPSHKLEQKLLEQLKASEIENNRRIYPDTIENKLLTEFLTKRQKDGKFVIVEPRTDSGILPVNSNVSFKKWKENLINYFRDMGYDITLALNRYIEVNSTENIIKIKSSIDDGYYIDYNAQFDQYLDVLLSEIGLEVDTNFLDWNAQNLSFWEGYVIVSMPGYDPETGYVLIYQNFTCGSLCGSGDLYLLIYKDGVLSKIATKGIWVS